MEKDGHVSQEKNVKTLQDRNYTNGSTKKEQENTSKERKYLHTNNLTSQTGIQFKE